MTTDKYGQELPKEIEERLDAYIERIKAIKWFKPSKDFRREDAERQISVALKAFGVKASVEWRSLKTVSDWGAAWDAARDAARGAAWDAAWDAARDAARDAAWDAAWGAARDAAWGAAEILASDLKDFKEKYPNGAFLLLIPLWESGLFPCGVIDGKFVVYQPTE